MPKRKPLTRRQPVKRRNAKRGGTRFPKRRDPAYLDWIREQPCVVSDMRSGQSNAGERGLIQTWVVAAHHPSVGAGGTDYDALPLDTRLHDEQHRIGIKSFCAEYNLDWPALTAAHRERYLAEHPEVA